jgi:hypothetical protein
MDDGRGWRMVNWAAWGSGALAGLAIGLLPSVDPNDTLFWVAFAWLAGGGVAALFARSSGLRIRGPKARTTPLLLIVALVGGGAIGLAFGLVGAVAMTNDLAPGLALAAVSLVGALGSEALRAVSLRVARPATD